jgi:hypothetical protein
MHIPAPALPTPRRVPPAPAIRPRAVLHMVVLSGQPTGQSGHLRSGRPVIRLANPASRAHSIRPSDRSIRPVTLKSSGHPVGSSGNGRTRSGWIFAGFPATESAIVHNFTKVCYNGATCDDQPRPWQVARFPHEQTVLTPWPIPGCATIASPTRKLPQRHAHRFVDAASHSLTALPNVRFVAAVYRIRCAAKRSATAETISSRAWRRWPSPYRALGGCAVRARFDFG